MPEPRLIGLIINPIAGIGGPLAARGSDCFSTIDQALTLGGKPVASQRAERALARLKLRQPDIRIIAAPGAMGLTAALSMGFDVIALDMPGNIRSTASDTRAAADAMMKRGAEIILFAGGDGTAHDIFDVVGEAIPLVGIPAGVKMHSAVFAVSPEAAGETAAIAAGSFVGTHLAEIMDADPVALAEGRPSAHLFGYARTPALPVLIQAAKGARPTGGEAAIEAWGRMFARDAKPGQLVILGPGTTLAAVKRAFGFAGTLLGIDAVVDGRPIALDADATTLEKLCDAHADVALIIGVVGGQGFVFGRGNQQISPKAILRALDGDLRILANRQKLQALPANILRADTGDVFLDRRLEGYRRVETGPGDTVMMRLSAGL